jgi:transcription elongation factor GreA
LEQTAVRHSTAQVDIVQLRARVDEQLNRLSSELMRHLNDSDAEPSPGDGGHEAGTVAATGLLQQRIAVLGQLAAGLVVIDSDSVPARAAGYGSRVIGEELFSGRRHEYVLMLGSLIDIEAGQVSLASPIGQALFGRDVGDVVEIELPHHRLRLRIVGIATVTDFLEEIELVTASVGANG